MSILRAHFPKGIQSHKIRFQRKSHYESYFTRSYHFKFIKKVSNNFVFCCIYIKFARIINSIRKLRQKRIQGTIPTKILVMSYGLPTIYEYNR